MEQHIEFWTGSRYVIFEDQQTELAVGIEDELVHLNKEQFDKLKAFINSIELKEE